MHFLETPSLQRASTNHVPRGLQKESITVLNVRSHGTSSPQRFLSCVSTCLEAHGLVIDLISSSQHMLSLATCAPEPHALDNAVEKLGMIGDISLLHKMSIVSVIGHRMRNMVGIGAEIFSALANAKVNIYLISQGASEINISYVSNQKFQQAYQKADDSKLCNQCTGCATSNRSHTRACAEDSTTQGAGKCLRKGSMAVLSFMVLRVA